MLKKIMLAGLFMGFITATAWAQSIAVPVSAAAPPEKTLQKPVAPQPAHSVRTQDAQSMPASTTTLPASLTTETRGQAGEAVTESDVVGSLADIEGQVTVKSSDPSAQPKTAADKTEIHLNDTIMTGTGARAMVLLIDETQVTLGENATFAVDDYVYDPDQPQTNKARYSFLNGAFLYVSGLVAKVDNPDVQLATPYGSIGIRGTTVWGGQMEEGYGVFVKEGHITLQTKRARVSVGEGEGTSIRDINALPERAHPWSSDRVDAAVKRIALKDEAKAQANMASLKSAHGDMIARYKKMAMARRAGLRPGISNRRHDNPEFRRPAPESKTGQQRGGLGQDLQNRPAEHRKLGPYQKMGPYMQARKERMEERKERREERRERLEKQRNQKQDKKPGGAL
jgi:hypothetical protein